VVVLVIVGLGHIRTTQCAHEKSKRIFLIPQKVQLTFHPVTRTLRTLGCRSVGGCGQALMDPASKLSSFIPLIQGPRLDFRRPTVFQLRLDSITGLLAFGMAPWNSSGCMSLFVRASACPWRSSTVTPRGKIIGMAKGESPTRWTAVGTATSKHPMHDSAR
jgi:hypothetical protein